MQCRKGSPVCRRRVHRKSTHMQLIEEHVLFFDLWPLFLPMKDGKIKSSTQHIFPLPRLVAPVLPAHDPSGIGICHDFPIDLIIVIKFAVIYIPYADRTKETCLKLHGQPDPKLFFAALPVIKQHSTCLILFRGKRKYQISSLSGHSHCRIISFLYLILHLFFPLLHICILLYLFLFYLYRKILIFFRCRLRSGHRTDRMILHQQFITEKRY